MQIDASTSSAPSHGGEEDLSTGADTDSLKAIAHEAYIYAYPLVKNYLSMYQFAIDEANSQYKGPINQINNVARVFTPADTGVITPNSDTPYSFLILDLRTEPIVVSLPEIESGRYYSLQIVDLYTNNVDYIGTRRDGNSGGRFLIAGPGFNGETPPGIKRVVRVSTELAYSQFRTQLFNPADIDSVMAIQSGYKAEPLSAFLGTAAPAAPPAIDYPRISDANFQTDFWQLANFLFRFAPPIGPEAALRERLAQAGFGSGHPWPPANLDSYALEAIEEGSAEGGRQIETELSKVTSSVGLFGTPEEMAGKYLPRAVGAMGGIYGNNIEETIYPSYTVTPDGQPYDAGRHDYVLTFPPGGLPPVDAFWSVTMYDLESQLLVENPLDRYLINSTMLDTLVRDPDGGITLHLQHKSPGPAREANWLPAPNGIMGVVMRLYLPKQEAIMGEWKAPAISRRDPVPVTPENFVRAESDLYFSNVVKTGGFGKFDHTRDPAPLDKQSVIRLNRDTLYSAAVFDLDASQVVITLPDGGSRFMSLQVIDEDQYTHGVHYKPGDYLLTREEIGTRYVIVAVRTLVDPANPEDVRQAHALQDAIEVSQGATGTFETPNWDHESQNKIRSALLTLASTLADTSRMYGKKTDVDPVRFLIGAAQGWGANPPEEAMYLNVFPPHNDGEVIYRLTVKDVPVDGFWSISLYNAEGYYQENPRGIYSLNSITAKKDADGSVTVQFGGCDGSVPNCLPTMPGWNYMVRLYRPRAEILDGSWTFPVANPV